MTDTKEYSTAELIEFLDDEISINKTALSDNNVAYWTEKRINMLTRIKKILEQQAQPDEELVGMIESWQECCSNHSACYKCIYENMCDKIEIRKLLKGEKL